MRHSLLTTISAYLKTGRFTSEYMAITILPVTIETAEVAGRIIYDAWGETYRGLIPDEVLDSRSLARCIEMAELNGEFYRLAYIDGEAAGTIFFHPWARNFCTHSDGGEIVALYVLKKYQRQGVGKALIELAVDKAGKNGITLFVLKGNENAIGFYRAFGFEFTGKELFDRGMTELEMYLKKAID